MLVGEQPGNEEDLSGRPFVGPAGALLDEALAAAGLDRSSLYAALRAPTSDRRHELREMLVADLRVAREAVTARSVPSFPAASIAWKTTSSECRSPAASLACSLLMRSIEAASEARFASSSRCFVGGFVGARFTRNEPSKGTSASWSTAST